MSSLRGSYVISKRILCHFQEDHVSSSRGSCVISKRIPCHLEENPVSFPRWSCVISFISSKRILCHFQMVTYSQEYFSVNSWEILRTSPQNFQVSFFTNRCLWGSQLLFFYALLKLNLFFFASFLIKNDNLLQNPLLKKYLKHFKFFFYFFLTIHLSE